MQKILVESFVIINSYSSELPFKTHYLLTSKTQMNACVHARLKNNFAMQLGVNISNLPKVAYGVTQMRCYSKITHVY